MSARRLTTFAVFCAVALAGWSRSDGQQPRRNFPGSPWGLGSRSSFHPESSRLAEYLAGLLNLEKVKEDLKLTPEQSARLKELQTEARARQPGRPPTALGGVVTEEQLKLIRERAQQIADLNEELRPKIDAALLPEQRTRFKQIVLQMRGIEVLDDPEIIEELAISEGQVRQFTRIADDFRDKLRPPLGGPREASGSIAKHEAARKEMTDQMLALLTVEQKARFDKLLGAKIDIDAFRVTTAISTGRSPRPSPPKD